MFSPLYPSPETIAYLKSYTVLYEEFLGEQPHPCCAVTDIARLGVHGIQGRLASLMPPYLCQRHTAATGAAVRRLEVQPRRGRRVSN